MRTVFLAIVTLLALPAAAQAGTVTRMGSVLIYTANPGERNSAEIEMPNAATLLVNDGAGVTIDPDSGCTPIDASAPTGGAQCPVDGTITFGAQLADGDDRFEAQEGVTLSVLVAGGDGNDRITTDRGSDGLDGGAGNDTLNGGPANDTLLGAAGNDLLIGGSGTDRLDGGAGDDRMDAKSGGGNDNIDCTGGGDDTIIRGATDPLEGCGEVPVASLRVPRQRVRAFSDDDGFEFTVRCAQPCAIEWELEGRDRSTRRRIHDRRGRLDRQLIRTDAEGFPRFEDAGSNQQLARPNGRATRRDIAAARLLRLRLEVTVVDRNSLETSFTRNLTIRR